MASRNEIVDALRAAMDEVAEIEADVITEHSQLADLGVDSLDMIEIVMVVEERLDIDTDTEDFEGVVTVADAVDAIARRANGS